MTEHIETAWQTTDSKSKLRNTVAKRVEFTGIYDSSLKQGLIEVDKLLEDLLPLAELHDKEQCK